MKKALKIFIDDIENDRFIEAHEHLEEYWKSIRKTEHPLKNLCKGFINGATAFELVRRGNMSGARRLWSTYEKYLPLMSEGIENYELFLKADIVLQELKLKSLSDD
jgi:predicted metal-dependent hydrolase